MKRFIALLNEPANAKDFVRYGMRMAEAQNASIQFIFVQDPNAYPLGTPGSMGTAVAELQKNLAQIARQAESTVKGYVDDISKELSKKLETRVVTEMGDPVGIIERLIEEDKANEILLESKVEEGLISETVSNMDVVRNVKLPVWVIPDGAVYKPFSEIIYATDYKEEDISTLRSLIDETQQYSPKIVALHITDSIDFEEKTHRKGFKDEVIKNTGYNNVSVESLKEDPDAGLAKTIKNYSDRMKANLIVVLKENRGFLERIFKTSTSKNLIKESHMPVLVYHTH